MTKFIDSPFIKEFTKITYHLYEHGWDERNGGNVSYRLTEEEVSQYEDVQKGSRTIPLEFDASDLANMYFLVTGTGKYFKNMMDFPSRDVGLVRIAGDGKSANIVWGFDDGGKPTSEFPTHLMGHAARLKVNPNQRVIMHCHPTNLIAMTFICPLDEKELTKILWKMQTESIVVFPGGVGIVPWMVPGNNKIGEETCEKLKEFSSVIWPHHGIFASGTSIDEAYGLIETIEKAAEIYNIIQATGGNMQQTITDQQLAELADAFAVKPREDYLEV